MLTGDFSFLLCKMQLLNIRIFKLGVKTGGNTPEMFIIYLQIFILVILNSPPHFFL